MSFEKVIIGDATLYLGDSMEILPLVKAHVAIADPVYGIGSTSASGLRKVRKSKTDYGSPYFVDSPEYVERVMIPLLRMAISQFGRAAITPGNKMLWSYPKPDHIGTFQYPGSTVMGCWGPMLWQAILFYGKDPHQGRLVPDSIQGCNDSAIGIEHPCPKPLKSWTRLVQRASKAGETVCDYAMGSGTTGVSCIQTGRKFVGIEIDDTYFDIACKRIEQAHAQGKLFEPEPTKQEQAALL